MRDRGIVLSETIFTAAIVGSPTSGGAKGGSAPPPRPCYNIFDSLNQGAYPFVAGQRRAGASDQSPGMPRLFGGRKISNPNFCSIHFARRAAKQPNDFSSAFQSKHTKRHRTSIKRPQTRRKIGLSRR